ncbi:alpha-(1,3)-fucosyltransferase 11-like [Watersipora subatra]|uniref:alpha-(1,3)-fucosyltransferase 11-like n=1 Tax=Watersipora subatra TaxID=2589382 RepID=UPI00355B1524
MFKQTTALLLLRLILLNVCDCDEFSAGENVARWTFGTAGNTADKVNNSLNDIPVIIWWTETIFPHLNVWEELKCPNSICYSTQNKDFVRHPQTTAFYFYGTDFNPKTLPLPRLQKHLWALAHEESPLNNFILDHAVGMNVFNYTATYHRAADFPITTMSFPGIEFILNRAPVSVAQKNEFQKQNDFAPVMYVQSHCEVPSDRDRYVEELMQYIKIDSYGKCLHNKDLPLELVNPVENMFDDRFKDLIAKYKFVLSFENGFCDDYMTEKLFRPLHVGSVPVYRGSRLAKEFMPDNNSVIMTDDFASPKDLAAFLHKLNQDDGEYEKFLNFKKTKKITNQSLLDHLARRPWRFTNNDQDYGPFFEGFECFVCDRATEVYRNNKARQLDATIPLIPPKLTDGRKFACPAPELYKKPEKRDWWFQYDYTEQYWQGLDKARAMRDMLKANESDSNQFPKYLAKYGRK